VGAPMSIPVLPDELAELLDDASPAADAATDARVKEFIAEHQTADRPGVINGLKSALIKNIEKGKSCHTSAISAVTGAMSEAAAGLYPAQLVIDTFKPIFLNAVALGGSSGKVRTGAVAQSEFAGILAWAVAQANAADLDEVRARVENKMPNNSTDFGDGGTGGPDTDISDLKIITLADVEPERVQWLWPGRIPVGKLVMLDGDPGLGKSTVAIDVGATVTTGGFWPDGSVCNHPGAVLIMSAEDGLADTVRPRCDAAGADVTKVHAIEGVPIVSEDGEVTLRPPTLADVVALENTIKRTGAKLLVIDVIMAYLPGRADSHKDQDIRAVLSRLSALADRTGCSVLLLRHLNKTGGRDPLYRGGGSIGIVGAARSGLLVAPDPDDPERRVLASVKSNLGPAPDSLAYRLVESGDYGVARVQWEGVTAHTARTLLDPPDRDDDNGLDFHDYTAEFRQSWLHLYLKDAAAAGVQVRPKDAVTFAADKGVSRRSVFRLFDALANAGMVESIVGETFPKTTHWRLKAADTIGEEPGAHKTGGTTGTTGPDLRKQGGTTGELFDLGGTTGETAPDQVEQAGDSPVVPVVPPFPEDAGVQPPPGALTERTPGHTDRVAQALAKVRANISGTDSDACEVCERDVSVECGLCDRCQRASARGGDPDRCDECGWHVPT
jgi:hypothetical protein